MCTNLGGLQKTRGGYSPFVGSRENYQDILSAIRESGLEYFGIRVSYEERPLGAYFNLSEDMEFGGKTNGTSTIGLYTRYGAIYRGSDIDDVEEAVTKAMKTAKKYGNIGSHISIVGGSEYTYGSDEDEYVINNNTWSRRKGARLIYKIK